MAMAMPVAVAVVDGTGLPVPGVRRLQAPGVEVWWWLGVWWGMWWW